MTLIDNDKEFDSVRMLAVMQAIRRQRVDERHLQRQQSNQ